MENDWMIGTMVIFFESWKAKYGSMIKDLFEELTIFLDTETKMFKTTVTK